MQNIAPTTPNLPEDDRTTAGPKNGPSLPRIVAVAESLKHRNAFGEDKAEASALDKLVAPWFDRACSIYLAVKGIKADELAGKMGVDSGYFSKMRSGLKPIAKRHEIALMDCPEAVAALHESQAIEAGLEPSRQPEPIVLTEDDFRSAALEIMTESPAMRETLAYRVAKNKGVRVEVVAKFLGK